MVLRDRRGGERKRNLEILAKDYGKLRKSFIRFTQPADIAGTAFLSWENDNADDTQYLYLPALGRARRIVTSQKNLTFVNTDFTYEDMQRRQPEKDNHKLIAEEDYNNFKCYIVESIPQDAGTSQYLKRVSWVDKASSMIVKVNFYDKKGELSKLFQVKELKQESGIWTAMETIMEDLKEGTATLMKVTDVRYNQGLDDEIFTERRLQEQ
jgi:outer membrane lipoprotein-sorting protein